MRLALLALGLFATAAVQAQGYPAKPIRWNGLPPSCALDLMTFGTRSRPRSIPVR